MSEDGVPGVTSERGAGVESDLDDLNTLINLFTPMSLKETI
jgi:hypothetical protein